MPDNKYYLGNSVPLYFTAAVVHNRHIVQIKVGTVQLKADAGANLDPIECCKILHILGGDIIEQVPFIQCAAAVVTSYRFIATGGKNKKERE